MNPSRTHSVSHRRRALRLAAVLACLAGMFVLAACSTKKNTAGSRFWQSFTARYNTYFNGNEAYKEGIEAKEKGNEDNFTEMLPYFMVGNEKSAELGKGNFETAITKCKKAIQQHSIKKKPTVSPGKRRDAKTKQYLERREFNPFLKNAWLLMGRAQFQKGDFSEAAATFSYITRLYRAEPDVANEARAWLARCYAAQNWYYDAEDVLAKLGRDSLRRSTRREADITTADLLLRQGRFADALSHLKSTIRLAGSKLQKARLYYLLGQVEQQLGHYDEAYRAFAKCRKQSPPYRMALNARIQQTEALSLQGSSTGSYRSILSRLRRMARSDNNKEYLDRIYYAIGNVHLAHADTAAAIAAYETGRAKSTRSGIEKGVLLLRLGALYWDGGRYDKAQGCYTDALGLIDKTHKDYAGVSRRSKILDKLVPHTSAVFLQDSLQALAAMPEAERNAAIDRVIEALRQREKAEERARRDSAAAARKAEGGDDSGNAAQNKPAGGSAAQNQQQTWYFYNPMLVQQGKQDFKKRWGDRKNEDDWRRSNKTVVQMADHEGFDYEADDSLQAVQDSLDALEAQPDSVLKPEDDPHERAYYLKQIPFSEEQKAASDLLIMDGLYNAGLIEKDELEDFDLAARTLGRIARQYPSFDRLQDTYYQLYLLYARQGRFAEADRYRDLMAAQFPDSTTTKLVLDPNYLTNARFAKEIEDSLYAATYNAYRLNRTDEIAANFNLSTTKYPNGANRPKFIFVHALSRLGTTDSKEVAAELRDLVKRYPKSDVSELAGMIVNGLEAGRVPGSGAYDLGSLWDRRTAASATDSTAAERERLSAERLTKFALLIAYPLDSLDDKQLLYDIAHFNFTGFYVRNFDIERVVDYGDELVSQDKAAPAKAGAQEAKKPAAGAKNRKPEKQRNAARAIMQFRIHGFNSYDEAHAYTQNLYRDPALAAQLRRTHIYLISEKNLAMLGRQYSFNEYQAFFDSTFAPIKLRPDLRLDTEEPAEQRYEDRLEPIYPLPVREQSPIAGLKADSVATDSVKLNVPETGEPQPVEDEYEDYPADEDTFPTDEESAPARRDEDGETDVPQQPEKVNPLLPEKEKGETPQRETPEEETDSEDVPVDDAPAEETPAEDDTPAEDNTPEEEPEDDGEWFPA